MAGFARASGRGRGKQLAEWEAAENVAIDQEIALLDAENARYQMRLTTADGKKRSCRWKRSCAYAPNRLSWIRKLGIYLSRWWEFLLDEPREANSEGGVFPAIWGTVVMTLIMSIAVVPFGVLAALYLREYAKAGTDGQRACASRSTIWPACRASCSACLAWDSSAMWWACRSISSSFPRAGREHSDLRHGRACLGVADAGAC